MGDLISRHALLKRFGTDPYFSINPNDRRIFEIVTSAPAVDAEVVRHGRWIDMQEDDATEGMWRCSACGFDGYFDIMTPKECGTNYCPNCGAKMEQEDN